MICYLASPYTDPRPSMVAWRYKRNVKALRELTAAGQAVFSPIATYHPMHEAGLRREYDEWIELDLCWLRRCSRVLVLTLPGWHLSRGVEVEVREAARLGLPVVGCDVIPECEDVSGRMILRHFGLEGGKSW